MANKFLNLVNSFIWVSFLALALVTPLLFTTQTTELFELPKMIFVYFAATLLLFGSLIKFVLQRKIVIPKNLILTSLIVFTVAQVVSTFFSIDKFTSVFGFPTRLNGGLISQFAYLTIFYSAIINLNSKKAQKLLIAIVLGALAVALWGIPGHFGFDPSCFILTGKLTSSCWQKEFDPTVRIFSTLGQPNWLASYLVLVIPLGICLFLYFKSLQLKILFFTTSALLFWALVLTNSRAGAAGIILALLMLFAIQLKNIRVNLKPLVALSILFLIIGIYFGTTLKSRIQEAITSQHATPGQNQNSVSGQKPTQSALSSGGTESSQIRLIVWQGAIDIFKHSPVFGTGPETFVSSYFMFRPVAHNQTTEWDFFYNKAHNEFLNYLANSGILGFVAYLVFILTIVITLLKMPSGTSADLSRTVHAGFIGYQTAIFFGFSTVAPQTVMFLLLAAALSLSENPKNLSVNLDFLNDKKLSAATLIVISTAGLFFLTFIARLYLSDILIKRAEDFKDTSPNKALAAYNSAVTISPVKNPYLLADYASSIALYSNSVENPQDNQRLAKKVEDLSKQTLDLSPNNFLIVQKLAKAYILINPIDSKYEKETLALGEKLTKLAPTYPISFLTLAKIQVVLDQKEEALNSLHKALDLKPDYAEAQQLLEQLNN